MTWQGYSPSSDSARGEQLSHRRVSSTALREEHTPKINLRGSRTKLRRYRRTRIVGGMVAAALVAVGAIALIQNSNAAAQPNMDCTLIVPANPLSAAGLATPYQLTATNPRMGQCHEANPNQSAYVQGAIIDANGNITLYNPLVIDKGTKAAATPAVATVPAGSTVGLWFGFNGNNLTLKAANGSTSLQQGKCVNGLNNSIFGQFAYCNAPAFFSAANAAIAAKTLSVPAVGTARDGGPCPTVRDFSLVDMDQSDNVTTHYLANAKGQIAQANSAGRVALQGQQVTDLFNASDNRLIDAFVDPAQGCVPWMKPDQSNDNQPASSLPLNELQAAANQKAPIALVPLNDPMAMVNATQSTAKVNLYRAGAGQAAIGAAGGDNGNGQTYCMNLFMNAAGVQRIFNDQAIFMNAPSPDPAAANNLFTFLAQRANQSFTNLGCLGNNPVQLVMKNNVVVNARFILGGTPAANNQAKNVKKNKY